MDEICPRILPKVAISTSLLSSFTCRKFTTWDRRLYFPSERRRARNFFAGGGIMYEKLPRILPKVATSTSLLGSFTCRKFTTWDRRLYFPSEWRRAEDFFTGGGTMDEKFPRILPKVAISTSILGSFTCRKFTTWDRRLYFPTEWRRAEDFFRPKNPTASTGFEPANLGTRGQHAQLYTNEAATLHPLFLIMLVSAC